MNEYDDTDDDDEQKKTHNEHTKQIDYNHRY